MTNLLERTRRPDITFYRNGRIRIAARVARILSIHPGDSINIACRDGEYLLFANRHETSPGRFEAQCHPTNKGCLNFCASSVRLCRALLSALHLQVPKVAFMTGQPVELDGSLYLPIITRHPI